MDLCAVLQGLGSHESQAAVECGAHAQEQLRHHPDHALHAGKALFLILFSLLCDGRVSLVRDLLNWLLEQKL